MATSLSPFGVRDYLPTELKERQRLVSKIEQVFEAHSFEKIRTPTLEYYDGLSPAMGEVLKKTCIPFFTSSGARMVLRPDHTLAIARVVSSRLNPLQAAQNFYYEGDVFRKDPLLGETEIFQIGVESIGLAPLKGEADIIALCVKTLKSLGVNNFTIDIGHPSFTDGLSSTKLAALYAGDYCSFGKIPTRGGVESLPQNHELRNVHEQLVHHGIVNHIAYNQGLLKDPHVYNGLVFECHVHGFGKTIGSGGRYDQVFQKFGISTTATGFSLRLNHLEEALKGGAS